jgi:hypothetical protein
MYNNQYHNLALLEYLCTSVKLNSYQLYSWLWINHVEIKYPSNSTVVISFAQIIEDQIMKFENRKWKSTYLNASSVGSNQNSS